MIEKKKQGEFTGAINQLERARPAHITARVQDAV